MVDTEARVRRLEVQVKSLTAALLIAAAWPILTGFRSAGQKSQSAVSDLLVTKKLVVQDSAGNDRIILDVENSQDRATIRILGGPGNPLAFAVDVGEVGGGTTADFAGFGAFNQIDGAGSTGEISYHKGPRGFPLEQPSLTVKENSALGGQISMSTGNVVPWAVGQIPPPGPCRKTALESYTPPFITINTHVGISWGEQWGPLHCPQL